MSLLFTVVHSSTSVAFLLGLAFRDVFFFLLLLFNDACKQYDGGQIIQVYRYIFILCVYISAEDDLCSPS